jgi:hypothetical protein
MSLSSMLDQTVTLTLRGSPVNVGGVNVPAETVVTGVRASIQESSAAPRTEQDVEGSVASGKAFFDADPGVKEGDIITWRGRSLICSGAATDAAGKGILYRLRWTEIT